MKASKAKVKDYFSRGHALAKRWGEQGVPDEERSRIYDELKDMWSRLNIAEKNKVMEIMPEYYRRKRGSK